MGVGISHQPLSMEDSLNDDVCLTPCKRVLYVDPRSPSAGIDRTPIVVQQQTPELFDPRSPTPGIVRTPITDNGDNSIQGRYLKKGCKQPSSAAVNLSEDKFAGLSSPESVESPESSSDTCHLLGGLHQLSLLEDRTVGCENSHLIQENPNLVDTPVTGVQREATDKDLPKSRARLGAVRASSTAVSTRTRSPLRSRNHGTDSPRNIIQRKQMHSLDNKITYKTPVQHSQGNTPPTMDKENIVKKDKH